MIYIIVAGLLFCHWDKNRIVLPEVQLMDDFPFQHPGIDFLREAKECDPPVVGAHPLFPLFTKGNERHCPRTLLNIAKACQPREPHNIQSLKELRANLVHPRGIATDQLCESSDGLSESP